MNRAQRAQRLQPLVREEVWKRSYREVAADVGVSHTALHNFLERGDVPYARTLEKLERWAESLRAAGGDRGSSEAGPITADEIIRVIDHPGLRDVFGNQISDDDRVAAAFAIASREGLPGTEMEKLRTWRDQKRGILHESRRKAHAQVD